MAMTGYSTSEVAKLLGLSASQVRGYVRAGFLSPERGSARPSSRSPSRTSSFSARPAASCRRAWRRGGSARRCGACASSFPTAGRSRPCASPSRGAGSSSPTGRAAGSPSRARSSSTSASPISRRRPLPSCAARSVKPGRTGPEFSADDWYEWGCELEPGSPGEAIAAYRRALALDPAHPDAHVNLGRLLHEAGDAAARRAALRGGSRGAARRRHRGLQPGRGPRGPGANARGPARLPESRPHRPGQRRRALQRRIARREARPAGRGAASPADVPEADAAGIRLPGTCFLPCPCCVPSSPP